MGAFESPTAPELPASDVADANRRLGEFIDGELLAAEGSARPRPRRLVAPRRLAWVSVAAVLVVSLGLLQFGSRLRGLDRETPPPLRGEAVVEQGGSLSPVLSLRDGGTVTLVWDPVDGADDYVVVLHDAALGELDRLQPAPGSSREFIARGEWLVVIARQAGREIARSEPVRIR
jgi:hypothetical protein